MNLRPLAPLLAAALLAPAFSSAAHARAISFEIVPTPRGLDGQRSPDGRWNAVVEEPNGKNRPRRVVFTNLRTRRSWPIALPARSSDEYGFEPSLSWSPNGRAIAIRSKEGWRVAYPQARHSRLVLRDRGFASYGGYAAAWAPRTNRLAIFEDQGAPFYIWNGKRLSRAKHWIPSTGYPYAGDVRIWQAAWSPDESAILLRFYGHAERGPESAGHTQLLSPRTGRAMYGWGDEARPASWLDAKRLIYLGDDGGLGGAGDLIVSQPSSPRNSRRRQVWLRDAVAWTISPRAKTIWALKANGDLMRSPTRAAQWKRTRRLPKSVLGEYETTLTASPHGNMVAVSHGSQSRKLTMISTGARAWVATWATPGGTFEILGWKPGRSLPLLAWNWNPDKPARIIQLKW